MDNFLFASISSTVTNLLQPLLTLKNMKYANVPFSYKPSVLYRGYIGTCLIDMSAYSVHNICNYALLFV